MILKQAKCGVMTSGLTPVLEFTCSDTGITTARYNLSKHHFSEKASYFTLYEAPLKVEFICEQGSGVHYR